MYKYVILSQCLHLFVYACDTIANHFCCIRRALDLFYCFYTTLRMRLHSYMLLKVYVLLPSRNGL